MRFGFCWALQEQEQQRDVEDLSALAKQGKPLYGESDIDPYMQGVAYRNSVFSQLKFSSLPWSVFFFALSL